MKRRTDVENIDFLNNFSWRSLDCVYRPYSILSENLVNGAGYYYLLFRAHVEGFGEFVQNRSGIQISHHRCSNSQFHEIMEECIDGNVCVLLMTNQYYNHKDAMYGKKHHGHPLILGGYDDNKDTYIVLDENYATSKMGREVEFIFSDIERSELFSRASTIAKTNYIRENEALAGVCSDEEFCYYTFRRQENAAKKIEGSDIVTQYKEILPHILAHHKVEKKTADDLLITYSRESDALRQAQLSYFIAEKRGINPDNNRALVFKNHGGVIARKSYYMTILHELSKGKKIKSNQCMAIERCIQEMVVTYAAYQELFYSLVFPEGACIVSEITEKMYEHIHGIFKKETEFFEMLAMTSWDLAAL